MKNKQTISKIVVILLVIGLSFIAGKDFLRMHKTDPISKDNPNIKEIKMLSEYSSGLKGTAGDTEIYIIEGEKPGGKMLILGGTHPNEIAGPLNAIIFIENAKVEEGTLYIIPRANNSGFTHTGPLWGMLDYMDFQLADGSKREFRVGTRLTNPIHQWPDYNYYHGASNRELKHTEVSELRNFNRNHPGDENGTLTERINYGVYNLINSENIDITYDAHEAGPEFLQVNHLIVHDRAMPLASTAVMNANIDGLPFKVEIAGAESLGLSHRSLGNTTETLAVLFETLNPLQGMRRGKMSKELVLGGFDDNYVELTNRGLLNSGELYTEGESINKRVGYHMVMCNELMSAFTDFNEDKPISVSNMPSLDDIINDGLENYLLPINN